MTQPDLAKSLQDYKFEHKFEKNLFLKRLITMLTQYYTQYNWGCF